MSTDLCTECQHNCSSDCDCWCHHELWHEEQDARDQVWEQDARDQAVADEAIADEIRGMLKRTKQWVQEFVDQQRYSVVVGARAAHESLKEMMAAIRND